MEHAREAYGVVVDLETVDVAAIEGLRSRMRPCRGGEIRARQRLSLWRRREAGVARDPSQHPHAVAARREFETWRFHYLEPRERMRSEDPVDEVRRLGPMGEGLAAFLNTLKSSAPKQFRALEKALHALVPNVDGIDVKVNDYGDAEICLRENGSEVSARLLSDGTLRMLGLLALTGVADGPALVGFEEPENGVHPGRIDPIAGFLNTRRMTGQTQFIITTHSPILPDLLPTDSLLVASRQGDHTRIEPLAVWGPAGPAQAHRRSTS